MFTEKELESENWKEIDGYDGMYQVSDLGRVRSLKFGKVRVLRASKDFKGYLRVGLWKENKVKRFSVHRLVAQAFIPNDNIFNTEINHINEIKSDNRVSNIEWCDRSYNVTYNNIHLRHKAYIHTQPKRDKVKDLYDQNLSIPKNLEIFKANGIECSSRVIIDLRKDLGLSKPRKQTKAN